jgi:hypothetical protein
MKKFKRFVLVAILPCFIYTTASAWHPHKDTGGGGGSNRVPIDGGIALLVAAGIGFGAKKIMNKKKRNTETADASL